MVFFSVFIVSCVVWWFIFRKAELYFNHRAERIEHKHPISRVNYQKIARLEIEIYGETKPNPDSPVMAGNTNAYGIDESGHYGYGDCNTNALIGPVCREISPLPSFPGDPLWSDEDGRPW